MCPLVLGAGLSDAVNAFFIRASAGKPKFHLAAKD